MADPAEEFRREREREIAAIREDGPFRQLTQNWINEANLRRYSYHFDWLGRPVIQYPQDIVAAQQLIWSVKPDLIIETGIAHGGSLVLSASLLCLLDVHDAAAGSKPFLMKASSRKVIGIDVDIRRHNRDALDQHFLRPYMHLIEGSSIAPQIVEQVRGMAAGAAKTMVFLDSNHTHDHVLGELRAYADLVSVGSYCVVFDTIIENLPEDSLGDRPWSRGNNAMTAVRAFLEEQDSFVVDADLEAALSITVAPSGFLKRIK